MSRRGHFRSMVTPGSRACRYETASGRAEWPNRDPIQERGGVNLYAFVGNKPVERSDLWGLFESSPVLRATVPGQISWDNAVTCWEDGDYWNAASWSSLMVAEQALFVASFGYCKASPGAVLGSRESVAAEEAASAANAATKLKPGWFPVPGKGGFTLGEGKAVMGLIKDGKVIGLADPVEAGISHAQMAKDLGIKLIDGKLPPGVEGFLAQRKDGVLNLIGAGIQDFKLCDEARSLLGSFFQ